MLCCSNLSACKLRRGGGRRRWSEGRHLNAVALGQMLHAEPHRGKGTHTLLHRKRLEGTTARCVGESGCGMLSLVV